MTFPLGSVIKNLPVVQEMQVQSLGQENPWSRKSIYPLIPLLLNICNVPNTILNHKSHQHCCYLFHYHHYNYMEHLHTIFSNSHVWMWQLNYKYIWVPKNWCFWTVVFEKTLESPLDCKEIQPMHLEGNHSWICIERTDVEAGEGVNRGWDGYMASPTPWIWVWVNSRIWWWTRKPGIQQSMGSQRFKHDWATELNWMLLR